MKIEHAALYVRDLERARAFFGQYFGAVSNDRYHNPWTDFESYFLTFDSGARLEIMTKPGLQERCSGFLFRKAQDVRDLDQTGKIRADTHI